ncbi:hypothetical protein [Mesorhizobium sp. B4-1-1]|uniref:hypothetical protein n=1 Tax=Mesorhizobium sp. B4-1-1 TaxID=2589890 RepID=UPI00112823C5|nr:hypothetical protein [Mesorhizobium sp. B4-1-1]TPI11344.1 hypothetical protein FJW10_28685 [Mesorhizobium sp. B4-1-1]
MSIDTYRNDRSHASRPSGGIGSKLNRMRAEQPCTGKRREAALPGAMPGSSAIRLLPNVTFVISGPDLRQVSQPLETA